MNARVPSPDVWTLDRHILEQQRALPDATGDFTGLFQQIALASKIINSRVKRAGLLGILGGTGEKNVHGELVQKLDDFANRTLVRSIEASGHVCAFGSEEEEELIPVPEEYPKGRYVLLFDPLDGSGNIDVNASIGTIFSIYRRVSPDGTAGTLDDLLQPGRRQVAAGYVIYGSSTILVYTAGRGVHGFTLDPGVGEFFLSHENIQIPAHGKTYSVNEGNSSAWRPEVRAWAEWVKAPDKASGRPYGARYIGAMVADFHRTLLRGGIFAYPGTQSRPEGKLRLLYEANPLAFVAEAAGGAATNGAQAILDLKPRELHQRTPLFIGSTANVSEVMGFINKGR